MIINSKLEIGYAILKKYSIPKLTKSHLIHQTISHLTCDYKIKVRCDAVMVLAKPYRKMWYLKWPKIAANRTANTPNTHTQDLS